MTLTSVMAPGPESARLATLRSYAVLDTGPEAAFDEIVRRAAGSFGAASAAIALVDADRCWFKARVGLDAPQMPRDASFCGYAVSSSGIFVVPDALLDDRFSRLPLAVGPGGFRFYAGAPLRAPDGQAIGTLCVLDRQPREPTKTQLATLADLAGRTMALLDARRPGPSREVPAAPVAIAPVAAGGVVLIVDDEESVRAFTAAVMQHLGHEVFVAANGADALAQIAELHGRVRLVITDLNMPVMGGLDLVRALRRQPAPPAVVAMSGNFDPKIRAWLQAEGVTSMLGKPFSMDELELALLHTLAGRP
jgi:CheY-like chemotaxis protein